MNLFGKKSDPLEQYRPPNIQGVCAICGSEFVTDEIVHTFVQRGRVTGWRKTVLLCKEHGLEFQNASADSLNRSRVPV